MNIEQMRTFSNMCKAVESLTEQVSTLTAEVAELKQELKQLAATPNLINQQIKQEIARKRAFSTLTAPVVNAECAK